MKQYHKKRNLFPSSEERNSNNIGLKIEEEASNEDTDSDKSDQSYEAKHETKLELSHDGVREVLRRDAKNDDSIIYSLIPERIERDTGCAFPEHSADNVKAGHFVNVDGVQMKVYKMKPAMPGWFDQIKDGTKLTYSTGEKLASKKGRRGKWYYKNGTVAMDYYYDDTEGEQRQLAIKRYVIYSHDEDPAEPQSVLACFDDLCNGVVYDMNGKERMKYNQSEGKIIDPKLGPPCCWKWHCLNEPPDLQYGFIDTHPKNPSPELERLMDKYRYKHMARNSDKIRMFEDPMLSIELQNVENAERAAEKGKYMPNKIKMKAVKINEYFSLRLFEQAKMYVLFKDGDKHLKLNLGMSLISNTIIGFNVVEAFDVVTPYTNIRPAQSGLSNIKKQEKMREKLEAVRATNHLLHQFELKRDCHSVVDTDASKFFASSFKLIHLR